MTHSCNSDAQRAWFAYWKYLHKASRALCRSLESTINTHLIFYHFRSWPWTSPVTFSLLHPDRQPYVAWSEQQCWWGWQGEVLPRLLHLITCEMEWLPPAEALCHTVSGAGRTHGVDRSHLPHLNLSSDKTHNKKATATEKFTFSKVNLSRWISPFLPFLLRTKEVMFSSLSICRFTGFIINRITQRELDRWPGNLVEWRDIRAFPFWCKSDSFYFFCEHCNKGWFLSFSQISQGIIHE